MEAKHKPATPLPWEDREVGITSESSNGYRTISEIFSANGKQVANYVFGHDAAYIAHAANAYPRLVDALRVQITMFHEHDEFKKAESLEALLRELGEDA